jgi:hypothetical protein
MNSEKAFKLLQLIPPFSLNDLKRHYHKQSLKLHPDKNTSINATAEFQDLNDAYEYLKQYITINVNESDIKYEYEDFNTNETDFFEILNNFTSKISGKKIDKSIILNIIDKLTENKSIIYTELFEGIDKETSIDLFEYIKKYSNVFNISNDVLESIGNIINKKYKNDEIIKLYPNINNLMNDDLYKLDFEKKLYYIPLWHHEIIYDISLNNNQLIINIIPSLEQHISIDDNNNIHVHLTKSIKGLLDSKYIVFNLGEKVFNIPCEDLRLIKKQKYIYKKKGIPKIDIIDVYNVNKRGDIIVHLTLLD